MAYQVDIDNINIDVLQKDDLVDALIHLTGGQGERWRAESIRSLRVELASAVVAAREARATTNRREGLEASRTVVQQQGLSSADVVALTATVQANVERSIVSKLRLRDDEEGDGEGLTLSPAALKSLETGEQFRVPDVDPTWINPYVDYFERLERKSREGLRPRNVALWGPTGAGKTTFAIQFAAQFNRPLYILNFGEVTEAEQLLGHWEAKDGSTLWVPSVLSQAITVPFAVILCDELNRGATAKVVNGAFEMLDDRRSLGGVPVAPGVVFFATLNEGVEYTGTDELDAAINDRFPEGALFSYGSIDEVAVLVSRTGCKPELAESFVRLANVLRGDHPLSLRLLGAAVEEVKYGAPMAEAILITFGRRVPATQLQQACAATLPDVDFTGYLPS